MKKTIAIASVLMAAVFTGILSTSPIAFAQVGRVDAADLTVWRQNLDNVGSGDSTNNNCALNSIDSAVATVACPVTSGLPPSTLPPVPP